VNFSLPPAQLQRIATSPMLRLNVLAALTGAAVACLAWLFLQMIDGVQWLFYRDGGFLEHNYGVWQRRAARVRGGKSHRCDRQ